MPKLFRLECSSCVQGFGLWLDLSLVCISIGNLVLFMLLVTNINLILGILNSQLRLNHVTLRIEVVSWFFKIALKVLSFEVLSLLTLS
jgi:hypothetical protein